MPAWQQKSVKIQLRQLDQSVNPSVCCLPLPICSITTPALSPSTATTPTPHALPQPQHEGLVRAPVFRRQRVSERPDLTQLLLVLHRPPACGTVKLYPMDLDFQVQVCVVPVVALVQHHAHAATPHLIKHSDCCPEQVDQLRVRQPQQLLASTQLGVTTDMGRPLASNHTRQCSDSRTRESSERMMWRLGCCCCCVGSC